MVDHTVPQGVLIDAATQALLACRAAVKQLADCSGEFKFAQIKESVMDPATARHEALLECLPPVTWDQAKLTYRLLFRKESRKNPSSFFINPKKWL